MVELRFDGQHFGWWQKVDIRESVDDLCAGLRLAITRPDAGALNLTANTVVEVWVDGALATVVRPDIVQRQVEEDSHGIHLEARSLGRELVDCQWSMTRQNQRLGELVLALCGAFKVPVKIAVDTAVVPDFSMQCESPANALLNAVRAANLLLYPLPDGGLILTEPTSAPAVATLTYGRDIKRYTVVDEYRVRFSEYHVKGYDHGGNSAIKGAARDDGLTYFRPLHIVADRHGQGQGGCDRRALLERNRRLARAHRLDLEVAGWSHPGGLWAINTQVRVVIPPEGIDEVLLIGERSFSLDDQGGHVTRLQVMPRAAFEGQAKASKKRHAGVRG